MSTQKLSLSSPVFSGRIKKYDSYRSNTVRQNINSRSKSEIAPGIIKKLQLPKPEAPAIKPIRFIAPEHLSTKKIIKTAKSDFRHLSAAHTRQQKSHATQIALSAVTNASSYGSGNSNPNANYLPSTVYASVKPKTSKLQKFIYAFGITVFIFSAGISVQTFLTNNDAKQQLAALGESVVADEEGVLEGSGSEPSESEVSSSAIANYQVADPTHPRYLRIPALNIFSRVKNLGTTDAGAVDAPKNIHDVGWYNGSAKPGVKAGASLLLGHVSGWTAPGIFKNANKLVAGDSIEIERGDGEKINYKVTRVQEYPLESIKMGEILSADVVGENDLKLMTCSGNYNKDTKLYDHRMVVYAKKV